ALLVQRRCLHDEHIAEGVLHHLVRNGPQSLPLARAKATVADDDEVRRVRADRVEKSLCRIAGDEPLLDVSCPLLGKSGYRLIKGLASAVDAVKVALHAFAGSRFRARFAVAVRSHDDQLGLRGCATSAARYTEYRLRGVPSEPPTTWSYTVMLRLPPSGMI